MRDAVRILCIASGVLTLSCEPIVRNIGEFCSQPAFEVNTVEEGTAREALCTPGAECTLRAALASAAFCRDYPSPATPRTITLPADAAFLLTRAYEPPRFLERMERTQAARLESVQGAVLLPRIFGNVVIEGNGATIDGGPAITRLFHVPPGGSLTLRNLTLVRGGGSSSDPRRQPAGAGVYNEGMLIASATRFSEGVQNTVFNGPSATFTATNCRFDANRRAILNEGSMTLTGGAFEGNQDLAEGMTGGGAIRNEGTATITGVTFTGNFSRSLTPAGSVLYCNAGSLTLRQSTLQGNGRSDADGEAVHQRGGTLLIEASTFTANSGINAGSVYVVSGSATIRSSTFHGERSRSSAALHCASATGSLSVEDSTVTGNAAAESFGIGGLQSSSGCALSVSNTIAAANTPRNCGFATAPVLGSANLSTDASCTGFSVVVADAQLGALTNNGGPTATQLPVGGGAAVDRGISCRSVDQRGLPRPAGPCDIGAVERQPADPPS